MAEIASSTRAVASKRSIRRVSPGPEARSLQKRRFLRSPNDKGNKPYVGRCLGYYSYQPGEQAKLADPGLSLQKTQAICTNSVVRFSWPQAA